MACFFFLLTMVSLITKLMAKKPPFDGFECSNLVNWIWSTPCDMRDIIAIESKVQLSSCHISILFFICAFLSCHRGSYIQLI